MTLTFEQISEHAASLGASDIHLSPNVPPMVRIDGALREIRISTQTPDDIRAILSSIMTPAQEEALGQKLELNFIYDAPNRVRYRVNAFTATGELSATFRIIPSKPPTLSSLDSPYAIKAFANLERGLVIISGTIGSGKSTTLSAMIDHINRESNKHIITIEDPIEFIHKPEKSLISQRMVGVDTKSYEIAIQSALLEDPDVIVIDELRDAESITHAIMAANAGCLVLTTLNASSTSNAINHLMDPSKPELNSLLADSLSAIITQRLIPKATGRGRVAAYEIMPATKTITELIRTNKTSDIQTTLKTMVLEGAVSMDDYIQKLVLSGSINEDQRSGAVSGAISSDDGEF